MSTSLPGRLCDPNSNLRTETIETRHLKVFVAVYKNRSFTKAAELLHTSQPTVSEHIHNLESRLDCRLFDRLGRSILPTLEAQLLYPRALAILEDLRKLEDEVSATGKGVAGELIIGASTIPGEYIIPRLASSFKARYPGVSFEIRIGDSAGIVDSVADNDLLIGIVGARIPSRKVNYQTFIEDELILVAAADTNIPDTIEVTELTALPFLMREEGSGTRKNIEAFLARKDLGIEHLKICATLGSSTAIKESVKAGLGVSIISRLAMQDELQSGLVKEIRIKGLTMKRSFYIISAPKRSLPNHYRLFLNQLLEEQRL
ncbi:MAG TPA: selenium metabolism-associated LysR family transcriptional regulator [Desulfoprunum sp.]|nr:selenium metabolism-associated LysR family transcriptional regulator [Desulfoprunum sp.]